MGDRVNERKVELPRGGSAVITTRTSHGQKKALQRALVRLGWLAPGNERREDLAPEEQRELEDLIVEIADLHISTYTISWDGVRSTRGDLLTFPAGLDDMDDEDTEFLFAAIQTALTEGREPAGRADPNPSGRRSRSTSRPGYSRKTPTSVKA